MLITIQISVNYSLNKCEYFNLMLTEYINVNNINDSYLYSNVNS